MTCVNGLRKGFYMLVESSGFPAGMAETNRKEIISMKPESLFLFAVLAMLTGCASYEWERSGGSVSAAASDREECHELAHLQSKRNSVKSNPAPVASAPANGKETIIASHSSKAESPMEMDQENACMRARGYRLVARP